MNKDFFLIFGSYLFILSADLEWDNLDAALYCLVVH
jgi:hypothetical protein